MKIKYCGHSSFLIQTKNADIVTDPFDTKMLGIKFPSVEASIVTVSHQHPDHNQTDAVGGEKVVFDFPGEYERKGVRIIGYQSFHDDAKGKERGENIIFKIIADGITIVHLGDLGHIPDDELMENIKDADILLIPVGGFYTIDAKTAVKIADIIKPEILIPMHFNDPKLNQEAFGKLLGVDEFLSLVGKKDLAPVSKLDISVEKLPEREVVLLDRF
ncbi:MAG: MBL fold metallo-hydrolase [Patescibacteria group bacterium]